jgi:ATP-dependent Lhr-like helicase
MEGWPAIQRNDNALILAPTGSGKTLSAFLWAIDSLVVDHLEKQSAHGLRVVYVSPLKALSNDIEKNLQAPLEGISRLADADGLKLTPIRTAVRTGDTPPAERSAGIHPKF